MEGKRMFKRRNDSHLEGQLRSLRAEARDGFVDELSATVDRAPVRGRRTSSRLAFASAVAVFILGTFASFGGLSYAASGATHTVHAVKVTSGKLVVKVHKTSATDMYDKPQTQKVKPVQKTQAGVAGAQAVKSGVKGSGTLPFTGVSLLSTLVLSLALIVTGIFLRRRERQQD
jgi:hypothetical protein